jgi:hypothetical protein
MKRKKMGAPSSTPKSNRLVARYILSLDLQVRDRRCARCGVRVSNDNLGAHARKSALAGLLWCQRCSGGNLDEL